MSRTSFGEIGEALARIEAQQQAIAERVGRIETKIDAAPTMRDLEPFHARVKALEATQTWVVRSIVGAVVTGLVGVVLALLARFRMGAPAWVVGAALALVPGDVEPRRLWKDENAATGKDEV